jgi:hypothetical protein
MGIDEIRLMEQQRNQAALRVKPQAQRQPRDLIADILMQQMNRASTDTEEEDRLRQLEEPD